MLLSQANRAMGATERPSSGFAAWAMSQAAPLLMRRAGGSLLAAAKIEVILQQAKVKLISLIKLIRAWLLLLPGVNRFFLEQEAKIKAEKLMILKTADE